MTGNAASELKIRAREELDRGSSAHIEASAVQNDWESDKVFDTHTPELRVELPGLHNLCIELDHGIIQLHDTIEGDLRIIRTRFEPQMKR
ncbi:hypothetical protein BWQ96_09558 [Gracilariopsis chorda]|uniref:Uncharacterized protein n=1 Tax=Gracilariopsis chorda TaxID=448386 RepID=A0A2V3IF60_9FLOR|nr:hypothetical protein BWQ96_09558 [Gracilariopsis chorda]|eukprot:PXF40725.1 hypothetical protein BWQ96_09558 [Gracilariopsis chorda]